MENLGKVISKAEVTETLVRNIVSDQEEFKNAKSVLRHGQKDRLIEAMVTYPLVDVEFDETEPELRTALTIYKRINDSLVALGTEAAIEGILNNLPANQSEGEQNVQKEE
jgi:hypothetical protein